MYELNQHKRKDSIKWAIAFGAIILIGILVVGLCLQLFAPDDKYKPAEWFKPEQSEGENTNAIITNGESCGVMLASARLLNSSYAEYGISQEAEAAYTFTASIYPSNANNLTVDYTVEWQDSASAWATGKSIDDYLEIAQSSNGSLTATLTCKQAFGERAIVTCTSRDNPSAYATATVDYVTKVSLSTFTLKRNNKVMLSLDGDNSETKVWQWTPSADADTDIGNWENETVNYTYTLADVGTITEVVKSQHIKITASGELKTAVGNRIGSTALSHCMREKMYTNGFSQGALFRLQDNSGNSTMYPLFEFCAYEADYQWDVLNSANYNKLRAALKECSVDFIITVETVLTYGGTHSVQYNVNVSDLSLASTVQSVGGLTNVKF